MFRYARVGGRRGAWGDAFVLAAAALVLRAPFASRWLWAWDSVLYARAIDDLSIGSGGPLEQRPHPPGYVFYVFTARALDGVVDDANAALVAVSVIAGSLAVVVGYAVARAIAGRAAGIGAGVVLLADPVLWHASVIAYPYVLLAFLSGVAGLVLWRARAGDTRSFAAASIALGLALGFRQDLALHAGTLWLFVAAQRGLRTAVIGAAAGLLASVTWLVPSAMAADGLGRYLALVWAQAIGASGLDLDPLRALGGNTALVSVGLRWQLLWLWPLAAAGLFLIARRHPDAGAFLLVWIVPSAASLLVLHTGEAGYTLALAVPLAVTVGIFVQEMAALPWRRVVLATRAAIAVLVVLLASTFVVGGGRFSAQAVARHDEILETQVDYIRANFHPSETALVGEANYLHAIEYLPEYTAVYHAPRRKGVHRRDLARQLAGRRYAVLLDDSDLRLRRMAQLIKLARDVDLYVIALDDSTIGRIRAVENDD